MFSDFIKLSNSYKEISKPFLLQTNMLLVNSIEAHLNPIDGLGYFKLANRKSIEDKIYDAIIESNTKLTPEDKAQIVDYYEKRTKNGFIKREFFMRAALSILILSLSFAYVLVYKDANQDFVKVMCGFIGVILGYWFR